MKGKDRITSIFPRKEDISKDVFSAFPLEQREYLINGEIRRWTGDMQPVISPIHFQTDSGLVETGLGSYPLLTEKESLEALDAAVAAYDNGKGEWPTLPVESRIRHIEQFSLLMREKKTDIVNLLMWEIGKSLKDSAKEFDRTMEYIADTVHALKELDRAGSRFEIRDDIIGQIRRAPLGVVLSMGPFNYPLNETFSTLIPALIMGNTVILKPPKYGVLLYGPLLEAFRDAFPAGVINTVYGDGPRVIGPLMQSGKISVLAFIGTSRVADILKNQHPKPHRLRSVLGMEAKNIGIVLKDADMDLAVKECLSGSLSFNGQRCTAIKIIYVQKEIADNFLKRFTAALEELKAGMPWEEGVSLTPLPEAGKADTLQSYLEDALGKGALIVNEGGGISNKSFFYPAVVYPVKETMRLYHEEQFGPIIPVVPFDSIEEPMNYVMNSQYGQQASVFGSDSDAIARLIDPLVNQVCRVNINSQCQRGPDTFPFTGRKDSAEGTLSVSDALRVFSIRTLVAAKQTDLNKRILSEILREKKSHFLSTDFIF